MADALDISSISIDGPAGRAEVTLGAKVAGSPFGIIVRAFFPLTMDAEASLAQAETQARAEAKRLFQQSADRL